jgi:hypothetical protein
MLMGALPGRASSLVITGDSGLVKVIGTSVLKVLEFL